MKKLIGKWIWNIAEYFYIDLGNYAPVVFGWMIGSKGKRIDKHHKD